MGQYTYNYKGMWRSHEVLDAEVAAYQDDSDGYALQDGPAQLVVVVLLFFTLVQKGKFGLVLIYTHEGLHPLLVDDEGLLQAFFLPLLTALTPLVPLASLTAFTPLAFLTGHLLFYLPLILASQDSPFLLSHQTQLDQFLTKQPIKLGTPLKIPFLTLDGILPSHILWVTATSITGLFAIHEADGRQDQTAHVPGRCPGLLMVIGKGGADGEVGLESARGSIEVQLGCCEGIILVELEEPVIEAARIGAIQVVQAEVEVQVPIAGDQRVGDGLLGQ